MAMMGWLCNVGLHWWKTGSVNIGSSHYVCRKCGVVGETPWT